MVQISNQTTTEKLKGLQPVKVGDNEAEIEKVVQIKRVSKKTAGGNRFRFSAVVVVGNGEGKVGVGKGTAGDVTSAVGKAANFAKKHQITVPLKSGTIPHRIFQKFGAAKVLLKPAPDGSGVIAGGAVRAVVEAAGIKSISAKILGTRNAASNVYATFEALRNLKSGEKNGA